MNKRKEKYRHILLTLSEEKESRGETRCRLNVVKFKTLMESDSLYLIGSRYLLLKVFCEHGNEF